MNKKKSLVLLTIILSAAFVVFFCFSSDDRVEQQTVPVNVPTPAPAMAPDEPVEVTFNQKEIEEFVRKFYSTLELTDEMNQRAYESDEFSFSTRAFYNCVNSKSVFSKKRLKNLTGEFHYYYDIYLKSINSVQEEPGSFVVYTTVNYGIYETGNIENIEKLRITAFEDKLIVSNWEDVNVKNMAIAEYEGLENYNEQEFYKNIGSVNK
jgi:hypothetical protein